MGLFASRSKSNGTANTPRTALRIEHLEDRSLPSSNPLFGSVSNTDLLRVDPVLLWNNVMLNVHVIDHTPGSQPGSGLFVQGGPTRTARAFGMVQGAVFDAVNSITRKYTPYLLTQTFDNDASKHAAVAVAAHDTLVSLFPQQRGAIDNALNLYLGKIRDGFAEREGIRAGQAAAAVMNADHADDGAGDPMQYEPGDQPGDHRVDPLNPGQGFLTPGWGDVDPFTMDKGGGADAFLSPPPPDLTSAEYADAFNEVKVVGAEDAETADRDGDGRPDRTREQTRIGIFWGYDGSRGLGTPPRLYNQIAQTLAKQKDNSLTENARMFALVNIAMADAGIQAWDTKYEYDFWRPILGIREADPGTGPSGLGDNNPDTEGEAGWRPLGAPNTNAPAGSINFTPNFPAYTSGHATFGAALFQMLKRFYGRDDIRFTIVSDEFNGKNRGVDGEVRARIPRTFDSFTEAAEENAQSRIYLGIHWAFDATEGIDAGNRIANFVFNNFLKPKGSSTQSSLAAASPDATASPVETKEAGSDLALAIPAALAPATGTQTLFGTASEPVPAEAEDAAVPTTPQDPAPAGAATISNDAEPSIPVFAAPELTDPLDLDRLPIPVTV